MINVSRYQWQQTYFVKRLQVTTCDDRDWHNVIPSDIIISLRRGSYYGPRFTNARRTSFLEFISPSSFRWKFRRKSWRRTWRKKVIGKHCGISMNPMDGTHMVQFRHFFIRSHYVHCIWYHSDSCCSHEVMSVEMTCSYEFTAGREKLFTFYFSFSCERGVPRIISLLITDAYDKESI